MKTAEEILKSSFPEWANYFTEAGVNKMIESMEEYAAQFNQPSHSEEEVEYEIDFDGHVLCRLSFKNGELKVIGAINGYGNAVKPTITRKQIQPSS